MAEFPFLSVVTFLPLAGALIVLVYSGDDPIAVRNIRRDAMHDVKELLKEKMIGEDEERRAEGDIQTITDKYVAEIDEVLAVKEAELMEI